MKKVNWGIVGLGNVALKFAEAFKYSKNAKLIGIASNSKNKIEKFKKQFHIEEKYCFKNYLNLLECNDLDFIYIALPNSLHHEWIIKCIEKKKKILVEKPATLNFAEIKDIKKNYYDNKVFFVEAFMYSYHPQILKVIDLLKNNAIGKLIFMDTVFGKDVLAKKNFFGFKKRKKINKEDRKYNKNLGGGVILDLGCYTVSFSTMIASLISKVDYNKVELLNKKKEIGSTGVDMDSYTELKFENNFKSKMGVSFIKDLGRKTKIIGSEGELIIENTWHGKPSKINITGVENKEIRVESNENIFFYEIEILSKCILDNKERPDFPGLTIDETYGNMKIIDKWLN